MSARSSAALLALLAAVALGGAVAASRGAGEARGADLAPAARARSAVCAGCHAEIAREWEASLHRDSWRDPLFQAGYAHERQAFCRACHAPEADPAAEPGPEAIAEGVGCVTCHVREGKVVGARPAAPGRAAPHEVVADARLAGEGACAACHEFAFPPSSGAPGLLMQATVREWRASSAAGTPCQGCHMPLVPSAGGGQHRSHALLTRTPEMLGRAVTVEATRGPGRVRVTLRASDTGHAFPTGDMLRRLEVRALVVDRRGEVLRRLAPVHLGRSFRDVPVRPEDPSDLRMRREEVQDLRVGPPGTAGAARVAEIRVPAEAEGEALRWEVAYQRLVVLHQAAPEDEVVIASGALPP